MNQLTRREVLVKNSFSLYFLLHEYDSCKSLSELQSALANDLHLLDREVKHNQSERVGLAYNFVKNFRWFVDFSNHTTKPCSLEDGPFGLDLFEFMNALFLRLSQ